MKQWAFAAVPLLAAVWTPAPAAAEPAAAIAATAVGVVVGGIVATSVVAGTAATIVGSAIGGGIACWWYDDTSNDFVSLPRKASLKPAPSGAPSGIVYIGSGDLRTVAIRH